MRVEGGASLEAMAANPKLADPEVVGREFEALLVGAIWKGAVAPLGVSKLLSGGSAGQMYREMFVDEVARQVVRSKGFGVGAALESQLRRAEEEPQGDRDHG